MERTLPVRETRTARSCSRGSDSTRQSRKKALNVSARR